MPLRVTVNTTAECPRTDYIMYTGRGKKYLLGLEIAVN